MGIPPNVFHVISVIVAAAFAAFTVIKVDPAVAGWAYAGTVAMILTLLKSIFTDSPQATALKKRAAERGLTTIPITEAPPANKQ
jgi:hypothetical protein